MAFGTGGHFGPTTLTTADLTAGDLRNADFLLKKNSVRLKNAELGSTTKHDDKDDKDDDKDDKNDDFLCIN